MAKNSNVAATISYEDAKAIVAAEDARRLQVKMDQLQARATEIIKSPTTQKVGIAALGAGVGAGLYALLSN